MYCPACGVRAREGALACASCAIIFSKWKPKAPASAPASAVVKLDAPYVRSPAAWGACVAVAVILFALREHFRGALFLLDFVSLAVHEAGHVVFGLLGGRFLMMAGGTLLQLIMPLAFVVDFRRRGQPRSSDACLAWVGQNLLHVGRYAADARAQRLPLVGGGEHDWTYLLETVGLLARDAAVGRAFDFAGCLLIAWAGVSIWDRTRSRRSSRGLILAAFFLTPVAVDAAPAPEKAVVRVMTRMRASLRYRPEAPAPRGAHEWDARRVLEAGTVNGCVESAKAFFALFRAECPSCRALYLDSFNAAGEGGHAVVQVTGSDGADFIVDAASFERLPGRVGLDGAALAAAVDIRPDKKGKIVQVKDRGDAFLEKADGGYRMTVYPPGEVFDGKAVSRSSFTTLAGLEGALADFSAAAPVDFAWLRDRGLILPFADAGKTAFVYSNPGGGLARYVIYGRFPALPEPDDAEKREPAARERHARTGGL
ncbi:MAG: hypothetical protein NDJ72_01310 [Elusimicrobia bacterium]|nr:hypothetical protein [Elusimicrobiota bacterium]